ncbi:hypothetical protein AJ80_03716 [Polytolypa hystricis UAMH7299]|uniref:Choline transport protein n=1 Tax=Polytolypa hystricis (strain UAMH7299) TaxID=1447883 RepID=A0A2B7YEV8_POLH7|nr:hypothetical protein AJ80_03716 [Polytolypa hystricis UAMH7299]
MGDLEGAHEMSFVSKGGAKAESRAIADERDNNELIRLGKVPILKRNFAFLSILGFTCTVLITWEASLILFLVGLTNGGPAGLVYGYLFVWGGNVVVFATLSELASMAPTSAGQYHWVAMLSTPRTRKFVSYLTGWITVCGWQATFASASYITGGLVKGLVMLNYPDTNFQEWHGLLFAWAIVLFCVFINTVVSFLLPKFEGLVLILHIVGFFAVLLPMVILGNHGNTKDVFATFYNEGGWSTQGLSFFVGLSGNAFAFVGTDGAFHMSEEVRNPSVVVPRSIMLSMLLNGIMGFATLVALLFCMTGLEDVDSALNSPTGYPFMEIFYRITDSMGGATTMVAVMTTLAISATVGHLASTSRMFWSFARDRGVPGWRRFSRVNSRTSVPLWSIALTACLGCALGLINLGSPIAFTNIVSLSIAGLYTSYLITCGFLLYRRLTGYIAHPSESTSELANRVGEKVVWGPFRVPGLFGVITNSLACLYLIILLVFSFFPIEQATSAQEMNYSSPILLAALLFSLVWYFVYGRKEYSGPIIET